MRCVAFANTGWRQSRRSRFAATLLLIAAFSGGPGFRCASTIPLETIESLTNKGVNAVPKNKKGFVRLTEELERSFGRHKTEFYDYDSLYMNEREKWISLTIHPVRGKHESRYISTEWKPHPWLPPLSVGMASWMLSLYRLDIGIMGIYRPDPKLVSALPAFDGFILAETPQALVWGIHATNKTLVLSNGMKVLLTSHRHPKSSPRIRRWIVCLPHDSLVCPFMRNISDSPEGDGRYFRYPGYLKDHIPVEHDTTGVGMLPGIPELSPCEPAED